jgi:hypothetical protein
MDTGMDIDAAQLAADFRRYPIDAHGKLRFAYGKVTAASALAADGTMGLFWLPPGRKRILPTLSRITTSAFGAGRTLDIGHASYMARPSPEDAEVADPDALVDGLDVSSAVTNGVLGTGIKFDIYSLDAVLIYGTVLGDTMPEAATVEVLLAYLYE